MKIKDIPVEDVRAGKNWRFCPPEGDDWLQQPMEESEGVVEAGEFAEGDQVIFSGLTVYSSGEVSPFLQLKTVGHAAFGGDFCEHVDGRWWQVGLVPDPDAPVRRV